MGHAVAYTSRELEEDPTIVDDLVVQCAGCDPDNPRAVPRSKCRSCGGSGQSRPKISVIVGEIKASKIALLQGGKKRHSHSDE